uniref:Pentacotripeptide-repeat region of PRORP domain-containing protein n=2 Tax=Clastoptera arizonana TaxID=38151 RepID=A0A1B6C3W0_9HEMI
MKFVTQKKATSSQSLMIIRCCGNLVPEEAPEVRTQLVNQVWNTLEKLGVPMDISHYNALLRVYLENEHKFSPTQFLLTLEEKGIEPNRITYQRLIAGFCQEGDIAGATRILEFMREKQFPVTEGVFNALILGHSQADDLESAHGIIGVMRQAGLEPSNETYTTLMCSYAKKGNVEALEKLFKECEEKDVFLNDKDILEVVYTLGVNNHKETTDKILAKIKNLLGYNQDAANVILRLLNKGDDETAFKIFRTMQVPVRSNDQPIFIGSFLIKQMVKSNIPVEKIIATCKILRDEGLNSFSFPVALQATFTVNNINQTLSLLQGFLDNNEPIRIHYFWPLLVAKGKGGDIQGVKNVLRSMIEQFKMFPNGETLKEYVLPNMKNQTPIECLNMFLEVGMKRGSSASSITGYLVTENKLKQAAEFAMQNLGINFLPAFSIHSLITAFKATSDIPSFVTLVRVLLSSIDTKNRLRDDSEETVESAENFEEQKEDLVGKILIELAKKNIPNFVKVLQKFLEHGFAISNSCAEEVGAILSSKLLTEEVSALLSKLASNEMEPEPLKRLEMPGLKNQYSKNPVYLETLKEKLISKGEPADAIMRQLLSLYCFNKDFEGANKIRNEMKAKEIEIPSGHYAQLFETCIDSGKLEDAQQIFLEAKSKNPDFTVNRFKAVKMANLYIQNDLFNEAIDFLNSNAQNQDKEIIYSITSLCWRMLNNLADKKNVSDVKTLLHALVNNNYVTISNVLLGPLIKAHLLNNDIEGALDEFEQSCELYRATPWKNDLMIKLIQAEDAANLQRLTDLSTKIHGEVNSLYDLLLAFVECGRIRQARKILETPGLRSREDRINLACERYGNDGLVAPLENLLEVTKDMGHIDKSQICYHLLLSYKNQNDVDKALALWNKMQEEDIIITDNLLITLGNLLNENNRPVPFNVPDKEAMSVEIKKVTTNSKDKKKSRLPSSQNKLHFINALQNNQIDEALEYYSILEKTNEELTKGDLSRLLEMVLKEERMNEANKLIFQWLPNKLPLLKTINFYLTKLIQFGDFETFDEVGKLMDQNLHKVVSFENKKINCLLKAGKGVEQITVWENALECAKSQDEVDLVCSKFPRGGMMGVLEQHPDCIPQYEQMMEKYISKGYLGPANTLFMYYFRCGQQDKAKEIYNKYLYNSSRLMFKGILLDAEKNNKVETVDELKALIKGSPNMTPGVAGLFYSTLINIYCSEKKYDEALERLEEGLKECKLENIYRKSLIVLKAGLELNNKTFKYNIPDQAARRLQEESSTSSSSDDERNPITKKQ